MWRLRVTLSGAPIVGPGLWTFYALDTSPGFPAAVRTMLATWASSMPSGITIQVPNGGDVINPADGTLTGAWTDGTTPAPITTSGTGTYARGVGAQVRWRTSAVVAGRRVQGSTFIVPMVSLGFDTDGTLGPATQAALLAGPTAYVAAAPYAVVWSRPYDGDPTATPPKPARAGSVALITGASIPDRPSWLLSRRR